MELLNEIWQTAKRNKLRTGLTGFAVAWGIFMLIVLLGAGNGLINAQLKQSDRFLSNSMVVFGGETSKPYQGMAEGRNISLKDYDIEATSHDFPENIDAVGAQLYQWSQTVSFGQQYISTSLQGVFPNHTKIDKVQILHGRFINDIDLREKRKVIVLSSNQAKELLPVRPAASSSVRYTATSSQSTGQEAQPANRLSSLVGRYVNVGPFAFRVVGILKDDENGRADAIIPYTTLKSVYNKGDDAGRIEFAFHGLPTEEANEQFEHR
jgi:putative ABC transport system permease protein